MRIIRAQYEDECFYGVLEDDSVARLAQPPFNGIVLDGRSYKLSGVRTLAPVIPGKIAAVGVNYRDHAQEMSHELPEDPILFLKPPSAVIGPGCAIVRPKQSQRVDYEGELAAVIKTRLYKAASACAALECVLGYTCLNDVTARDLQKKDGQWTRAKGFDTFAPVGPWIETDFDPTDAVLKTYVNGRERQSTRTSNMIHPVGELLRYISHVMTLEPGDIVTTGTPAGIGPLEAGDTVEVFIQGLGTLSNPVQEVQ